MIPRFVLDTNVIDSKNVPPEAWDELPTDGSMNVDHYFYGAPKR